MMVTAISNRIQRVAQGVAARLPGILSRRNLEPVFSDFFLTEFDGMILLIAPLNTNKIRFLEHYTDADLVHQISTEVRKPIFVSNHSGLRYVAVLSDPPQLPRKIDLPLDTVPGQVALGVKPGGQILGLPWGRMGHVIAAGMTGSGKSIFLRSMVYQAIQNDMRLLVADMDQATVPMIANHPALLAPLASTPGDALDLVDRALAECNQRADLFKSAPDYPENLDEYNRYAVAAQLPIMNRVLVILDEFPAIVTAAPAIKDRIASLGWRGRKFGLSIVFSAQEFTKEITGPLRDQVSTVICFHIRSADMARRLNCTGAEHIPVTRPGLAITDRWGPIQTFYVDKLLLSDSAAITPVFTNQERNLFERAIAENGAQLTRERVMTWTGVSEWRARRWLESWALRGWIAKDAMHNNGYTVTPKTRQALSNHPTPPSSSNQPECPPAVLQPIETEKQEVPANR